MTQIKQLLSITASVVLASMIWSCKKTEYTEYEKEPLNRILEYKVTNSQQQLLLGAIDDVSNTITLYIPYYMGIDHIVSEVKIDAGAKIFDESGKELDLDGGAGLEPVPVGDTIVKYTVKGSDGSSRTYSLVQEVLPYSEPLEVTYQDARPDVEILNKPVASRINIFGNFESTSKNAKFIFTDRNTGAVYENFFLVNSLVPGNQRYTMTVDISPDVIAGDYDVKVIHQGRTAELAPIRLRYQKPYHGLFSSSSSYAPGDTITFKAINYTSESLDGVYVGLERVYLKLRKEYLYVVPDGFPEELYDQEIELEIISKTRSEVKARFPDIPAGNYQNNYSYSAGTGLNIYYSGFGFYFDFDDQTDWGDDNLLATSASRFAVKQKQ